jgi:glycosyltransferase involved in cell wall biosynthesis
LAETLRKVLIITYYWPPSGGGGVQRWLKFVKYLRHFGWEPVVFTPSNPEMPSVDMSLMNEVPVGLEIIRNKIREPYSFYKKLTGKKKGDKIQTAFLAEKKSKVSLLEDISVWIRGNLFIPDARKFWINPSVKLLSKYIADGKVAAIITTGPPHSAHMIGMRLKERFGIPWLADFRDPWTNIDYYHDLKLGLRADRIHHRLEKQVLTLADALTVVSPGMKREFVSTVNRKIHVIPNGYDEEDIKGVYPSRTHSEKFSLAHIGSLTKTRNAENLWRALRDLCDENPEFAQKLEIRNVGKIDISAIDSMRRFGMEKYLIRIDYIPHEQVIAQQQKAAVLLLLVNNTPNAKLILTGKLFEYLASRRPVVCIGPPDGDAAAIISETQCGKTFGFDETDGLKMEILRLFHDFMNSEKKTSCINVERYERKNLTSQIARVLNEIQAGKGA